MSNKINVALIGCVVSSEIAFKELLSFHSENYCFSTLVTLKKSNFNSDFVDLTPLADKANIKVLFAEDNNDEELLKKLKERGVNLVLVIGWSKLIKEPMLSSFEYGMIGYHPAKLPLNRGRHPIIWSLALGLKETASTFFKLGEGADEGPICNQSIISINDTDRSIDLYNKLMQEVPVQINQILKGFIDETIIFTEQNEELATYWRKRNDNDGRIDWRMSSRNIFNLVRALYTPYPGAYFEYKDARISVFDCEFTNYNDESAEPGKIIDVGSDFFIVKTGDTALKINNSSLRGIEKDTYL